MAESDRNKRGVHNASSAMSLDAVVALIVLLVSGFFLQDLVNTEGSGAYVKTTTLPTLLTIAMMCLAMALLVVALITKKRADGSTQAMSIHGIGSLRVAGIVVWISAYVIALPWFGYSLATALFLVGACLLYGNRNPIVILGIAIVLPLLLLLFFEKFMIVLLPSSKLFG